jgi:hypothetical protein
MNTFAHFLSICYNANVFIDTFVRLIHFNIMSQCHLDAVVHTQCVLA